MKKERKRERRRERRGESKRGSFVNLVEAGIDSTSLRVELS